MEQIGVGFISEAFLYNIPCSTFQVICSSIRQSVFKHPTFQVKSIIHERKRNSKIFS